MQVKISRDKIRQDGSQGNRQDYTRQKSRQFKKQDKDKDKDDKDKDNKYEDKDKDKDKDKDTKTQRQRHKTKTQYTRQNKKRTPFL